MDLRTCLTTSLTALTTASASAVVTVRAFSVKMCFLWRAAASSSFVCLGGGALVSTASTSSRLSVFSRERSKGRWSVECGALSGVWLSSQIH